MYLKDRRSVVLNHNPFMVFKNDPNEPSQVSYTHSLPPYLMPVSQVNRAVKFIQSIVKFRNSLLENKLEPEIFHLNPARTNTATFKNIIRLVHSIRLVLTLTPLQQACA